MPDWSWGGALRGGISGGATGFLLGGPYGAAAGAVAGGALGGMAGGQQEKADGLRQQGAQAGIQGLQGLGEDMAIRRQADKEKAMGFYGPAMQVMEEFYGVPKSSWGDGVPANYRAAMQNLQTLPRKPAFQNLSGFQRQPAPAPSAPPPLPPPAPPPMGGASRQPMPPQDRTNTRSTSGLLPPRRGGASR